jgi:hypothetical protein
MTGRERLWSAGAVCLRVAVYLRVFGYVVRWETGGCRTGGTRGHQTCLNTSLLLSWDREMVRRANVLNDGGAKRFRLSRRYLREAERKR